MSYGKGVAEGGRRYFILLRMSERGLLLGNSFVSPVALPDSQKNVFSQIIKCICQNWQMDLSTFSNVFVWICKCICRLATALSVARPCAIPSKVRNFTLRLNRRRKCWVDKLHYKRGLQQQLSLTSTNLICIYEISFPIETNTYIYLNKYSNSTLLPVVNILAEVIPSLWYKFICIYEIHFEIQTNTIFYCEKYILQVRHPGMK